MTRVLPRSTVQRYAQGSARRTFTTTGAPEVRQALAHAWNRSAEVEAAFQATNGAGKSWQLSHDCGCLGLRYIVIELLVSQPGEHPDRGTHIKPS